MIIQKFSVNQYFINDILSWIKEDQVAVPEIQRPFVWEPKQVRDFIDSLYRGYPVGYIIIWQNPNVRLKDGTISKGKKILIDGQQRIISLMTSVLGKEIIDSEYKKTRITIAFNPIKEIFEVSNSAIQKDKRWISDISEIFSSNFNIFEKTEEYCNNNPGAEKDEIFTKLDSLRSILSVPIGIVELKSELDMDEVTEIFIRINSKGARLSQADFAMAKIAATEKFDGKSIRKAIDYFCHLSIKPEFYEQVENDIEFAETEFFQKMSWLKDEKDVLYDPDYEDMLRVVFTYKFSRGKLKDLVALLSGRDFKTKEYREDIAETTFKYLKIGILDYIDENNFKNFLKIIRSAGFIDNSMIKAKNALNFAYVIYLKLKEKNISTDLIERLVRKWFVFSILTERYSGSVETNFDSDIKEIENNIEYIDNEINRELSDEYWNVKLPANLKNQYENAPEFYVFLASQVKMGDNGFLSRNIKVEDLINSKGYHVHHIFPKYYLKETGFEKRSQYNQVANCVITQSEVNIAIGKKPPREYFREIKEQCKTKKRKHGEIVDIDELYKNLEQHCIPIDIIFNDKLANNYEKFLEERRKLMADKIKKYFLSL